MDSDHNHRRQDGRRTKKKKPPANPLVRGIVAFCERYPQGTTVMRDDDDGIDGGDDDHDQDKMSTLILTTDAVRGGVVASHGLEVSDLPKRYTAYPPLLLLPFNFATHSARWAEFYGALDEADRAGLFRCIAEEGFRKIGISRVAINAPIAAETEHYDENTEEAEHCVLPLPSEQSGKDPTRVHNVLRSPSGIVPVYGDWGPRLPAEWHRSRILRPTAQDFNGAFWTATSQHEGVTQVWAPLYTMFSRGNISEKGRILGTRSVLPGLTTDETGNGNDIREMDVLDLYVGIGYFAFCYLKRGVRRVYGWDINPWSIEGLRRGCERNGWRCEVVKVVQGGDIIEGEEGGGGGGVKGLVERIRQGDEDGREERVVRCIAFLGDNTGAANIMEEIQGEFKRRMESSSPAWVNGAGLNIRHVNLGLLPTSRASWSDAVRTVIGISCHGRGGWVHIHENVDVREIDNLAEEIVKEVNGLVSRVQGGRRFDVSCAHIEQVKTYAPGVMHCVYDIDVKSNG